MYRAEITREVELLMPGVARVGIYRKEWHAADNIILTTTHLVVTYHNRNPETWRVVETGFTTHRVEYDDVTGEKYHVTVNETVLVPQARLVKEYPLPDEIIDAIARMMP